MTEGCLIDVQRRRRGYDDFADRRHAQEFAISVLIGATPCVLNDGTLTQAFGVRASVRQTVLAGGPIVFAGIASIIGTALPVINRRRMGWENLATFPAFEKWACQHKCCHGNGNQPTSDHEITSSGGANQLVIVGREVATVKNRRDHLPIKNVASSA
jgi:hypothetical protein